MQDYLGLSGQGLEIGLKKHQVTVGIILERMRSGGLDQLKGDDRSEIQKALIEEVD